MRPNCLASLGLLLGLPLGFIVPGLTHAATLRPFSTLDGSVVRLSDLFDGADARALGPAPAPGGRISVEAPQLAAIARMFGVDWHPSGPGDRAMLERPGRQLSREDVTTPLRAILLEAGAPRDSDIELPGFSMAPLPVGAPPSLSFSATEYDAASGRFTTMLQVAAEGVPTVQLRLSGRVQEMLELPVPRRAIALGEVIGKDDLQWTRLRVSLARGEVVRVAAQAEGQAVRRPLQPGLPLLVSDLGRPVIVAKGTPMLLSLDGPGLSLTGQGIALEPGGLGERIHVTNTYSRAVLEAEITGPGRGRVLPSAGAQQVAVR